MNVQRTFGRRRRRGRDERLGVGAVLDLAVEALVATPRAGQVATEAVDPVAALARALAAAARQAAGQVTRRGRDARARARRRRGRRRAASVGQRFRHRLQH